MQVKIGMNKSLLLFLFFVLHAFKICAQELTVKSFKVSDGDILARTVATCRYDTNDKYCALIKVGIALDGVEFECSGGVRDVVKKTGEYWVYLPQNNSKLRILHKDYTPLEINFYDYEIGKLQSGVTYVLTLAKPITELAQQNTVYVKTKEESKKMMEIIVASAKEIGATSIGPFMNGIAPIKKMSKYAFINKKGTLITAFDFDACYNGYYKEDYWVVKKNGLLGVLDESGKMIVNCLYMNISDGNGYFALCKKVKSKDGAVMRSDLEKAKFDIVKKEDGSLVAKDVSWKVKNSYIYKLDNTEKFKKNFVSIHPFSEGVSCALTKHKKWVIIDQNGSEIFEFPIEWYPNGPEEGDGCFHDGLLSVYNSKVRKKGYINRFGKLVIPFVYKRACNFSEELAAVRYEYDSGPWSYIDVHGEQKVCFKDAFFKCGEFKNGWAIGEKDNLGTKDPWPQYLYDKNGNVLLNSSSGSLNRLNWYGADCFKFGLFPIEKIIDGQKRIGYINRNLKLIVSYQFTKGDMFKDEFTAVEDEKMNSGLLDSFGNIVWLSGTL